MGKRDKVKLLNFFKNLFSKENKKVYTAEDMDLEQREQYINNLKFSKDINDNINKIKDFFGKSFDLNIRRFKIGKEKIEGIIMYMSGLVESTAIEDILEDLEIDLFKMESYLNNKEITYETVVDQVLNNKKIEETEKLSKVMNNLSQGSSVIFIDGISKAILCETKGFQIRNIEEPDSEMSIRGPRDGFVENIFTNTSLLRQRIRAPHLWIQDMEIGSLSKTNVAVAYVKGLANEDLVEEVKTRLEKIEIDNVLESGYLQEFIKDEPFTIFPLIERTERPDKVVSCLVEGKIAILTNNTPFVLIVPATYNMLIQSPDDYYAPFLIGTFTRLLRHFSFLLSMLLPGIYIAIVNFHQELLPISLLLRISATREGVPFPIVIESLLIESLFEILREAGVRLPRAIGSAISIVGALVLGEAAISAGLVSPPMVIIVALTAISSFTTPSYPLAAAARILRFIFIVLGGTLGLFGIQSGFLVLLIHLCSLRSFGHPYFQPFGPLIWQDLKDSVVRLYWWQQDIRPKLLGGRNPQRQKKGQKPEVPQEEEED
jgi:spore germination protein KA